MIAEDSTLVHEGIARLLEDENFEVVGQAGTADELMLKVRSYRPDLAIVGVPDAADADRRGNQGGA